MTTSEHNEINERLDRIEEKIEDVPNHVGKLIENGDVKFPGGITPKDLIADHAELHSFNKRVLNALDGPEAGPEFVELDGTPIRLKDQGLVWQTHLNGKAIARIETTLANGVKTRWPTGERVAVIMAAGLVSAAAVKPIYEALVDLFS